MKNNFWNISHYLYLFFPLFLVFFLFSIIEIFLGIGNYQISFLEFYFFKVTNDFWTCVLLAIAALPLYLVLSLFGFKFQKKTFLVLFSVILIVQFILVKYALTSMVYLGSDVLGYSVKELFFISKASKETSILEIVPLLFIWMLFFDFYFFLDKRIHLKVLIAVFIALFLYHGVGIFYFDEVNEDKYQNKTSYFIQDIVEYKWQQRKLADLDLKNREDYPFYRYANEIPDVLSPFFNLDKDNPPNIVMLIVEGLGTEFLTSESLGGCMPFTTGLTENSLYWQNFIANTGRTFGVLPSLIGSLPMSENGFLENEILPDHKSMFNILKQNGYEISFYSGDKSSFDKKIKFLDYNKVDVIVDQDKYNASYELTPSNQAGFSWGYPDKEIFKKALFEMPLKRQPRLDVIMTLSNHEPFNFPNRDRYYFKLDSLVKAASLKIDKEDLQKHKDIFTTLFYTDNSIKYFIESYKKRADFSNTIFVITGDHRLIPINQKDKLCRFHVPLIIYSPMLKTNQKMKSVGSHWDVAPSFISMLHKTYNLKKASNIAWVGTGLDTVKTYRNKNKIAMMRYKGSINDFLYQDFLLSDNELYKVKESFGIYKVKNDSMKEVVQAELDEFIVNNAYVSQENRLIPKSAVIYQRRKSRISKKVWKELIAETKGLDYDAIFFRARDSAFLKKYDKALLLCDYVLEEYPNYVDAQILKGRIYAWSKRYKKSEQNLLEAIEKSPYYDDAYLAIMDLYWWSEQNRKSVDLAHSAFKKEIKNPDIYFKLAKAHERMGQKEVAFKITDSIAQKHPDSLKYVNYKNILK